MKANIGNKGLEEFRKMALESWRLEEIVFDYYVGNEGDYESKNIIIGDKGKAKKELKEVLGI